MEQKTGSWDKALKAITEAVKAEFGNLSVEELNWKPNPDSWSIAQHIEHIIIVNKTYFPVIETIRAGTYKIPPLGRFLFIADFFGNAILNSVKPDTKRRIKTFPVWQPSVSMVDRNIIELLKLHQEELMKLINSSQDLVNRNTVISSPANKFIFYRIGKAFEIIVTHEQPHLSHAGKVLLQLKNSR